MRSPDPRRGPQALNVPVAAALAIAWLLVTATSVLGASPSPSAVPGGDPRSSGQGPGLVGDPLLAIGVVALIALLALAATLAYVRVTGGPSPTGRNQEEQAGR
jgi:hypothetical protein